MKTLHIKTESTWSGGEQQVLYLVKGLETEGHTAHLICQPESGIYHRALKEGILPFPIRMRGEIDPVATIKILRTIRREKYDIIHSHTPHAQALVMWASCFLARKPLRVFTRRVEFSIFRHNFFGMNRLKYTKSVDHIIAISHGVKKRLIKDGIAPEEISVAHSGVAVGRYHGLSGDSVLREFSVPAAAPILGSIGYLEENKGQKHLIQAMQEVAKEYPESRLFILGSGTLESELHTMVKDHNLEGNVIFTGRRDDVGAFLNIFDVLVVSSVEEGLNSTILDALALEIPVVATDAGGIPEIIEDGENGKLVPRADHEALASGILWTLRHPEEAKAMAKKGCAHVRKEFSDAAMVTKNCLVYQKLLAAKEGGSTSLE